ncbi:hypothetical protein Tco_1084206 [Tanacetum coccineum]
MVPRTSVTSSDSREMRLLGVMQKDTDLLNSNDMTGPGKGEMTDIWWTRVKLKTLKWETISTDTKASDPCGESRRKCGLDSMCLVSGPWVGYRGWEDGDAGSELIRMCLMYDVGEVSKNLYEGDHEES